MFAVFETVPSGFAIHLNSYLSLDFQALHLSVHVLSSYCTRDLVLITVLCVYSTTNPGQNSCSPM